MTSETVIATQVQARAIDLLVMGSYTHSPLRVAGCWAVPPPVCCGPRPFRLCCCVDAGG
ncbi:MAG: hypothetical protein R3E89_20145 [Thiolinea sp.]